MRRVVAPRSPKTRVCPANSNAPDRARRLILGGTFDPVHLGHLHAAITAGQAIGAQRVTLLLAARPWHRSPPRASAAHRWAMLQAAVRDANAGRFARRVGIPSPPAAPVLAACDREHARPGPSYTVATLTELASTELAGEEPLIWLLGDDALAGVGQWHRSDELAALCHLLVFPRSHRGAPAMQPPPGFEPVAHAKALGQRRSGNIHYLTTAMVDVSATEVRRRIAHNEDASALLSPRVWAYIRRQCLYRPQSVEQVRRAAVAGGAKSNRNT